MKTKVLLARPSSFIVTDMKRLMTDMGFQPNPITKLADVQNLPLQEFAGAVVSIQINSTIPEDYKQVIVEIKRVHPTMPILLASLVEFQDIAKGVKAKFEGTAFQFYGMQEATRKMTFDPKNDIIAIQKADITDETRYKNTISVLRRYFA